MMIPSCPICRSDKVRRSTHHRDASAGQYGMRSWYRCRDCGRSFQGGSQVAIYLLIAATYTPFIMALKESYLAIAMLTGVWCAAIGGVVLKLALPGRYDRLAVGLYLALGWSGVMLYDAVVKAVPPLSLWLVVAGGVLYSLGVIFHAWQRLRFQNAIWHGFVLLGAACHYTAILDLIILT